MEKLTDISELIQLMFVGLMGAYKEIENILKTFHDENDKPSRGFLFIESLVHQPLYKNPVCQDKSKIWTFSPFPYRVARNSLFKTDEEIVREETLIRLDDSVFTQQIYERWKDNKRSCPYLDFIGLNEIFINILEFPDPFFAIVKKDKDTDKILQEKIEKLQDIACEYSIKSLEKLRRIINALRLLHFDESKTMTSFLIPIASSQIFYGDLFVCVPQFDYDKDEDKLKLKKLASELLRCVKKHYVPALALIHEHFFEKLIAPEIKKVINEETFTSEEKQEKVVGLLINPCDLKLPDGTLLKESYKSSICRREKNRPASCWSCDYFGWEESSDNVVEKYLHKLWQDRKTDRTNIEESLFFKNRLYTDPKMLDLLEDFLKPSKAKLKKDDDLLPSILVVASPGAGKDDIPKLIKLFSDCYNRGKTYKLNMASLKPDAIAPVTMVGGEITGEESKTYDILHLHFRKEEIFKLKGILREIREKTRDDFLNFEKNKGDEGLVEKAKKCKEELEECIKTIQNRCIETSIPKLQENLHDEINKLKNILGPTDSTEAKPKIEELLTKLDKKKELEDELNKLEELEDKISKIEELKDKPDEIKNLISELISKFELITTSLNSIHEKYKKELENKREKIQTKFNQIKKDEMGSECSKESENRNGKVNESEDELKIQLLRKIKAELNKKKEFEAELCKKKELENELNKLEELKAKLNRLKELENDLNNLKSKLSNAVNLEDKLIEEVKAKLSEVKKEVEAKLLSEIEAELSNEIRELEDDLPKTKELEGNLSKIKELEARLIKKKESKAKLSKKIREVESLNKMLKEGFDLKKLKPEEKLIVKEVFGRFPTIVLDELNSMSIESQGVLLRFLENAEITPIGGYEDEMLVDGKDDKAYREFITDFLVVGLMNEDPEAITREAAIRFLEKEKYIGGLLGDLLYEHILKIRRLRPDLRSRMMRNGIFKMPKLAKHRADIPVIFYGLMDKYKGDYFVNGKIRITMDALEYLMSPEWDWPENVRLLETLTKKVAEIIYEDYEKKEDKLIIVRERHIRKAMKEIGMLKESGIYVRNKFE